MKCRSPLGRNLEAKMGSSREQIRAAGAEKEFQSSHSGPQDRGDAEPEDQGPKREGPNKSKIVVIAMKPEKVCIS